MSAYTVMNDVVHLQDGGFDCFDTTVTARQLARMLGGKQLSIDPNHQRGKNSVTGKAVLDTAKIDRWARSHQAGTQITGQLAWNFRPEEGRLVFEPRQPGSNTGTLSLPENAVGWIPDSVHRHNAILQAVESAERGSGFDVEQRYSLRIWNVSAAEEDAIFHAMNEGGKKADATRGKWLSPMTSGEKLAKALVRRSPHLGEGNVETVSNTVSKKNPRVMAFNTLATGFAGAWSDIAQADEEAVTTWLIDFWDRLVRVLPDLGVLSSIERQRSRAESLAGWATAIQGYTRLARWFYDGGHDLALLETLGDPGFLRIDNPHWQELGVVVKFTNKAGKTTLTNRNSHQSRRAMEAALIERVQQPPAGAEAAAA